MGFHPHFSLHMARSPGFGSTAVDSTRSSHSLSLRLRPLGLKLAADGKSLGHYAKGTLQIGLAPSIRNCLYVVGFRISFTPRQGCFSVFAHATGSLSVSQEYVGLERGRPRFTHSFTSHALLRIPLGHFVYAYGPITRCGAPFQVLRLDSMVLHAVLQPREASLPVWPLPLSLAATDGISVISVPPGTKMFQFPGLASLAG
jgi:hypothetical protein